MRPSIRLAMMAVLSRKECDRATEVIKAAVTKVLTKRISVRLLLPYVIHSLYRIRSPVEHYDVSISIMHTCG